MLQKNGLLPWNVTNKSTTYCNNCNR